MFKYVQEVKEIISKYYSKWNKRLNPEMMYDIIQSTSFLDYKQPSLKERTFHYIFNKTHEDTCINCGNVLKFHNQLIERNRKFCSKKCSNIYSSDKIINSRKNKSNEQIQEKRKKTCLEKYGVEHVWQSKQVREKCQQTCLERYGYELNFLDDNFKRKSLETKRKKYGDNLEYITEKRKETCLEKYGVDNIFKFDLIIEKIQKKRLITLKEKSYDLIKERLVKYAKLELLDSKEDFVRKVNNYKFKCLICSKRFILNECDL